MAYVRTGTGAFDKVSVVGSLYDNDRLFTGREYDRESGLYYYRARYYDPVAGRFVSRDPIGQVDSVNLYQYGKNNPVRYLDPTGLNSKPAISGSYPKDELEQLRKTANSFAVIRTTPFIPANQLLDSLSNFEKVHTEIIFYDANNQPLKAL